MLVKFGAYVSELGLIIAAVALLFWYHKHQKFQDRLVRAEVERAELELSAYDWPRAHRKLTLMLGSQTPDIHGV